jgi:hypothetical protein
MPDGTVEGNLITGNSTSIAIAWKAGGGGAVAVHPAQDFVKFPV